MFSEVINRKILIVEDDCNLLYEMTKYFTDKRNTVFTAATLAQAKELYEKTKDLDAAVLDVILPDGTGLDLFRMPRENAPPVVVLSSLGDDEDIIKGLGAGAADYVTKPCSMQLLEMRIAIRLLPRKDSRIEKNGLVVDANRRIVTYLGREVPLTSSEFNILFFLVRNEGRFFLSDEIYEKVWGTASLQTVTVRKHVSALRRKLKDTCPDKNLIITEFGKGYCFPAEKE